MKLNKLFTFTLAALAMAACSNDDEPGIDKGGQKGALLLPVLQLLLPVQTKVR